LRQFHCITFRIHFKHLLPATEDVNALKKFFSRQGDSPRNPSSFSNQVADKFYHQVIGNEQKEILNTKYDYSSKFNVDLVEQGIPKL
jgi:hypothetical protein